MLKRIQTVTLDLAKLKPIRCKGRYNGSYVSNNMRPVGGLCENILAYTDGSTIIESGRVKVEDVELVSGERFEELNEEVIISGIDSDKIISSTGLAHRRTFDRWPQHGRSILYQCLNCGKERKVVGMQYRFYYIGEMRNGSDLFDLLRFIH